MVDQMSAPLNVTEAGASARVLVAEDDVIVGQDIESALLGHGFQVPEVVHSGKDAVQAARELDLDLVLMDVRMPGAIDGIDAARTIGEELGIPVVYLTAYSDDDTVDRAMSTAPYGYLLKPFQDRELTTTLELAIHRHRQQKRDRTYRQLVSSLDEGILIVGRRAENRTIQEVNEAAERIFGYSRGELVGETAEKLHVDREGYERFGRAAREALMDDGVFRGTYPLKRRDGTTFQAELTVTLLNPDWGLDGGVLNVVRDVSERKEAEEELKERERRYRAFVENATDLISTLDRDGRMLYQSPPVERLLGYEPEELSGRSVFELIHPDDREDARLAWEALVEEPGATLELPSFRFQHQDGSWRIWEATLTNLLDDPAVEAVLSNARDVTEREELNRQLRQSQKMEAVGRLAGGIAHDFNNLLTVIRSQSDLILLDMEPSSPLTDEMELVRDAAERAASLTSQLLAFSRDQVLQPRVVDFNEIIRGMEELLVRTLGDAITIEADLADDLPRVRVDPGRMEQVVMNLAVNARDAMPEGGTLSLSTTMEEVEPGTPSPSLEPGPHVKLRVSDTGVGMDEETRRQVFDPFFTTKGKEEGTGLGLSTSYGIVQQSGGDIEVESEPGRGSTFTVWLPGTEGEVDDPGRPARPETALGSREFSGSVLVVEDDVNVQRVTRKVLERAGLTVRTAPDAESALRMLDQEEGAFDLVLTDLGLPGMGGRELLDRIRASFPDLSVAAMSGYATGSPGTRDELPSDITFVQKPFTPAELLEGVRRQLGRE